tara:strand:+ start:1780 stop:2067 length:288 start_codon:yes stop_codon:yes gene_type:complete
MYYRYYIMYYRYYIISNLHVYYTGENLMHQYQRGKKNIKGEKKKKKEGKIRKYGVPALTPIAEWGHSTYPNSSLYSLMVARVSLSLYDTDSAIVF